MANNEFVAVSWAPGQVVDEDSLDQMSDNLTYLRNEAVDGKYMHLNAGTTSIGLKILCGRKIITPRKADTAIVRVGFAKMFTPDSVPVITTSIVSPSQAQIFHVINGIGRLHPNHQGFECKVNIAATNKKNDKIAKALYINWIAMGY